MISCTDVCNKCELHRQAVKNATNEHDKEGKLYHEATDKATKELKAYTGRFTKQVAACSQTFDLHITRLTLHKTFPFHTMLVNLAQHTSKQQERCICLVYAMRVYLN